MKKIIGITSLWLTFSLSACNNNANELNSKEIPQDNVCVVTSLAGVKSLCKVGEIVYFEPSSWGNEQLSTMFIAYACNTNKPVYHTHGGVVCTLANRKSINGQLINKDSDASVDDQKTN